MLDIFETAANQGKSCLRDADCAAHGDKGFCDSFLDYTCSTRCTSDEQCVVHPETNAEPYRFVCRADGRCAPDAFITTWQIFEETVVSGGNKTLFITAEECDFDIDWGDGTREHVSECSEDSPAHTYEAGTYTVIIRGKVNGWHVPPLTFAPYYPHIISVTAFGPVGLGEGCFANSGIEKFSDIDIPDATKLQTLKKAFTGERFNLPVEHWDTSYVTDMDSTFYVSRSFNQPLGRWNTANVRTMYAMFGFGDVFNQPLNDWDTSNVETMERMFMSADEFNQPLNDWDTSHVTNMTQMFWYAESFNQPLDHWDVSNITSMDEIFSGASAFNQPLNAWDVSNVEYMDGMFREAHSFNQPLDHWNTGKVKSTIEMFYGATAFDQDLSAWDVRNVVLYFGMFLDSGLSKQNYCKLMAIKAWKPLAETLEKDIQCP